MRRESSRASSKVQRIMIEGVKSWIEQKTVGKRMDTTLGLEREQPGDTPQARLLNSEQSLPISSDFNPSSFSET